MRFKCKSFHDSNKQNKKVHVNDNIWNLIETFFNLILIIPQLQRSTAKGVYLKRVELESQGTYKCEVSTEAPEFKTAEMEKDMEVIGKNFLLIWKLLSSLCHHYHYLSETYQENMTFHWSEFFVIWNRRSPMGGNTDVNWFPHYFHDDNEMR